MCKGCGDFSRVETLDYLPGLRELVTVAGFVWAALLKRDPSSAESRATRMRIMMRAPITKTTVKEPNATRAASRLLVALAAA
jgi:hypothetical protein